MLLAKVILKIISPYQTAFVSGRQILDGCLVANEIIKYEKDHGLTLLLFKIDFQKAFDSVNWQFLFDKMMQIGFGVKWRNLGFNFDSSQRFPNKGILYGEGFTTRGSIVSSPFSFSRRIPTNLDIGGL